jgi:hypothetical protein
MMRQMLLGVALLVTIGSTGCNLLPQRCTNCQPNMNQPQARQAGYMPNQQVMQASSVLQQQGRMQMPAQAMQPPGMMQMPAQAMQQQAGPPTAAYSYPYYTTRAPRDFLMSNPPSIGP